MLKSDCLWFTLKTILLSVLFNGALWPEAAACLPHICMHYGSVWGNKQILLLFLLPGIIIPCPLRWIIAHCATCRWVALLWLPYGHQALHIYCPWITAGRKKPIATYSDPPPSSTFQPSSLFYTFFVSRASQFFSVSCLSLTAPPPASPPVCLHSSFAVPWSCSMHSQLLN